MVSANEVRMGKAPARMAASIGSLSTDVIFPTKPYLASSRYSAVKTPVVIGLARVPNDSKAETRRKFSDKKTLRACESVLASVIRIPSHSEGQTAMSELNTER